MININIKRQIDLARRYPQTTVNYLLDKIYYQKHPAPFPRVINCFITERCNFNCPMCHVKESRMKKMSNLSFADLKPVFIESVKFSSSFQLTGGEPLLHPELTKMIRFLTDNGMVKGLVTNGLLLEEKAKDLVESGLDFLAISLDGPDENTQFKRGYVKNSFEKIIKGIEKIIKVRGKRLFPNIRVATVVSKINLNNFDEVLKTAEELGADQWSLSHYFYFPEKVKKMQETFAVQYQMGQEVWGENIGSRKALFSSKQREIIKDKYKKIADYQKSEENKTRISFQPNVDIEKYYSGVFPSGESVCTSPYSQIFIRGNGDVEMCQGYLLGNIRSANIKDIWHNQKANHFRKIFVKSKVMPACFRCCSLDIKF